MLMSDKHKSHNIVVCCSGTWCGADTGTRDNIQIIADGFASQGQNAYVQTLDGQPVYNKYTNTDICYFSRVGLDGLDDLAKKGKQVPVLGLLGGFGDTLLYMATGIIANDLPERCKEAYGFIMDKYQGPGVSRVWLFGLSRGAYTVRAVAGMVNNCGILKPADEKARGAALQEVWEMYRDNNEENRPGGAKAIACRRKHSWPRGSVPPIIFMGLLDTVGAEGIPRIQPQGNPASAFTYSYSFRDVVVSSEVQHVFQAASVHDRLAPFEPCPVRRSSKIAGGGDAAGGSYEGHYAGVEFSLQEVWYPGAHYDLGRQDFVFSNEPATNTLFRLLNPLRTNVNCSPELADYPLLGRALPAHGGPSPPQHLIGVPDQSAATMQPAGPAERFTGKSSMSISSGSAAGSSSSSSSELCLVAQVNKVMPGMLPPADDSAWEDLVAGKFAEANCSSTGRGQQLGLTSADDLSLLQPLFGRHSFLFALMKAGTRLMLPWIWLLQKLVARLPLPRFQPAYTIDAESKILRRVVGLVARLLDTQPTLLLKDRAIPPPTAADRYGLPVGAAVFFPVPADRGSFDSYKPGGRAGEWFTSENYITYQQHVQNTWFKEYGSAAGAAAAAEVGATADQGASQRPAVSGIKPAAIASSAEDTTQASKAAPSSVGGHNLASFQDWLSTCTTGMLVVPGEWFAELQQLPAAEQQPFIDALAQLGYMQLTQTAEEAILVSPKGVESMHNMLQKSELQAQHDSSSAAVRQHPQQDQGSPAEQPQQQQPSGEPGRGGSASGGAAGGGRDEQQQEENRDTGDSGEQREAEPGAPGVRAPCLPELPADDCVRLCLSSAPWTGHGLQVSCLLQHSSRVSCSESLPLVAQFKCASHGVELGVTLKMEACMQRKKKGAVVGFKLTHIEAGANTIHQSAANSKRSSGNGSNSALCGFMHLVKLSLEGQQQLPGSTGPTRVTLRSCNEQATVSSGTVMQSITYTFKEYTFKSTMTGSAAGPSVMLGFDLALKESQVGTPGAELKIVTVNPEAHVPVGNWHPGSPCTVEVLRQPLSTLLCSSRDELGVINTNSGNRPERQLGFKWCPSEACLEQGHLRDGALKVQLAVLAVGGVIRTDGLATRGKIRGAAMHLAESIRAGATISLGLPMQPLWQCSEEDCQVHAPKK